jgi:hypothetical protein
LDIAPIVEQLEKELQHRNRRVREAGNRDRLERAARLAVSRLESGVESSGGDSHLVDELRDEAIREEGVSGIGAVVAMWILQSLFTWAVRRAIQLWRDRSVGNPILQGGN